jgi:predicted metal-binding membrane protein
MALTAGWKLAPRVVPTRTSDLAFLCVTALVFVASAAATIAWSGSMDMAGMPMPGGWTMSMAWMRIPGQTWAGAAASFVAMWAVMMVAMMSPSLAPMLWRYRGAVAGAGEGHGAEARLGALTALVGMAYFAVWTALGVAIYPAGAALAELEMRVPAVARIVPLAVGAVIALAGALQLTPWKARHLACCREAPGPGRTLPADARTAWRHGLRLGLDCCACCAGPVAVLLAVGVMDLRAMAIVGAVILAERVAPGGGRVAKAVGIAAIAAGFVVSARLG